MDLSEDPFVRRFAEAAISVRFFLSALFSAVRSSS